MVAAVFLSHYLNGPLPYVQRHITCLHETHLARYGQPPSPSLSLSLPLSLSVCVCVHVCMCACVCVCVCMCVCVLHSIADYYDIVCHCCLGCIDTRLITNQEVVQTKNLNITVLITSCRFHINIFSLKLFLFFCFFIHLFLYNF